MNNGAKVWYGEAVEDRPFSAVGRVTSLSGTGTEHVQGEGPVIKVADVSTITCKVYELASRDAEAGTEVTPAPTLTSANVFDTLRTVGWSSDVIGYNFRHDVAGTYFADPGEWRCLEYLFTLTDGATVSIEVRVKIKSRIST